jgi:thiamine-monophosphate kinase
MPQHDADPTVAALSEGEVLAAILAAVGASRADVGPGDDAAVIAAPSGRMVATVDTLVHGPDFRLAWTSGFDLGWKAAAVNLADVAAMGATPTALLVALAMPDHTRLSFVTDVARGLRAACDALAPGCSVEGGDLTVSDTLTVAVTALGTPVTTPVTRAGARVGDVVAIAGELGCAAAGLDILFTRFRDDAGQPVPVVDARLSPEDHELVVAQLRPSPPIGAGVIAARAGATAMMDVSDGLALDASRLARASGVTIDLDAAALGPDRERALGGGEDHALLATYPAGAAVPAPFRPIGVVRPAGDVALRLDGEPVTRPPGWDPYRDWDSARG